MPEKDTSTEEYSIREIKARWTVPQDGIEHYERRISPAIADARTRIETNLGHVPDRSDKTVGTNLRQSCLETRDKKERRAFLGLKVRIRKFTRKSIMVDALRRELSIIIGMSDPEKDLKITITDPQNQKK